MNIELHGDGVHGRCERVFKWIRFYSLSLTLCSLFRALFPSRSPLKDNLLKVFARVPIALQEKDYLSQTARRSGKIKEDEDDDDDDRVLSERVSERVSEREREPQISWMISAKLCNIFLFSGNSLLLHLFIFINSSSSGLSHTQHTTQHTDTQTSSSSSSIWSSFYSLTQEICVMST